MLLILFAGLLQELPLCCHHTLNDDGLQFLQNELYGLIFPNKNDTNVTLMPIKVSLGVFIFDFHADFPFRNVDIRLPFHFFGSQSEVYTLLFKEIHDFIEFFFVCHRIFYFEVPHICATRIRYARGRVVLLL